MNQDDRDDQKLRPRIFVVMWDCNGLEAVAEVCDPALKAWAILSNKPVPKENFNIEHWKLRARFNSQRHYEIYAIGVDGSIDREHLVEMFDQDPQSAADLIRAKGEQLYSDRRKEKIAIV
jgi:hypothetical protein